jgi:hypothetical protein
VPYEGAACAAHEGGAEAALAFAGTAGASGSALVVLTMVLVPALFPVAMLLLGCAIPALLLVLRRVWAMPAVLVVPGGLVVLPWRWGAVGWCSVGCWS